MRTPEPFDLALTVESHGWYDLAPWRWDRERRVLGRPLRLSGGRAVYAEVAQGPHGLAFRALAQGRLAAGEAREAREAMAACLALDEDLAPFRARLEALEAVRAAGRGKDLPDLRWALARGAAQGRGERDHEAGFRPGHRLQEIPVTPKAAGSTLWSHCRRTEDT